MLEELIRADWSGASYWIKVSCRLLFSAKAIESPKIRRQATLLQMLAPFGDRISNEKA
ncbi:MAG: hypothetical protein NTX50_01650 [Candidatus Sumerlaeota bacterium]|nr:hypothetical protein [Candidatus Sumerlaeota bacterium]